jgi:alpha/beta superfamily hydrolase
MNNPIIMELYNIFDDLGFSTFRFNFRGVGKSEGKFDNGLGELADAAAALDWVQRQNPNTNQCWVSGFSFGAVICMQLLMRRPEITRFVSVSPQPNLYDFNFLAPCPASGLIVHGKKDEIAPLDDVQKLAQKLQAQKNITVEYEEVSGANHFYDNEIPKLKKIIQNYIEIELNSRFR